MTEAERIQALELRICETDINLEMLIGAVGMVLMTYRAEVVHPTYFRRLEETWREVDEYYRSLSEQTMELSS